MNKGEARITSPCGLDWRTLSPTDGGRFCGDCKKVVRDLSGMSEEEARALLRTPRREGLCVRFLSDEHGNIVFAKPPLLSANALLSRAKRVAAIAALPFAAQACEAVTADSPSSIQQRQQREIPPGHEENMGGVSSDMVNDPYRTDAGDPDATTAAADGGADGDAGPPSPDPN